MSRTAQPLGTSSAAEPVPSASRAARGVRGVRRAAVPVALALVMSLAAAVPAFAEGPPAPRPTAVTSTTTDVDRRVVAGIERHAHPLRTTDPAGPTRDLAALGRMTRGADVVGLGEATHGSKEIFALKDRILRHLVTEEGFSAYALEANWSAGVRLDAYVRTGRGDLRKIMREEFQDSYSIWNTEEFLRLFRWIREHNRSGGPQVRIVGNDVGDVNAAQYARILGWAAEHRPALLPELRERYAAFRALPASVGERITAYGALPLDRRQSMAADARAAYALLERTGGVDRRVLQEARVVSQMAVMNGYDFGVPAELAKAMRHRDRAMAENTVWWQRQTGDRIVLSAHNGHVTYVSPFPDRYPVTQGEDLRELLGSRYLVVGTSVHSADYRALNWQTGQVEVFSTGPAAPGSNEHTLDRVRHRDYYVDLRKTSRDPAAGPWLDRARPTFVVPASNVGVLAPLPLGRAFDVLVHLHRAGAAVALPGE